jgi:hypothetical protein
VTRFLGDWRNSATLLGYILVALLIVQVIDGMVARRQSVQAATNAAAAASATADQAKASQKAATRRVDLLTGRINSLDSLVAHLERQNAALAQQVRDMGGQPATVEPSPAPQPSPRSTGSPRPFPSASPSKSPTPRPSPSPTCRPLPVIGCRR